MGRLIDAERFDVFDYEEKENGTFTDGVMMVLEAIDNTPTIESCEDAISRAWVKENMLKFGFLAPDMTVTEFVEDAPPVAPSRQKGLDELVEGFAKALTYEDVITAEAEAKGYAQGFKDGMESRPQEWIPCSERLPQYREAVLISTFWGVRVAERDSVKEDGTDDFWYLFLDDATAHPRYVYAWMPLPEPWKGARMK